MGETDTISRQAAIEALARMMPRSYTPDGSHPADEEIFRAQEVFADCIEALEILPAAQPEPHWIPCSERLPGKPCYLLTSNEYGNVDGDFYWGEDSFEKANKYHYKVLAWKPLPEPYRGGDA